jgi:hypothetical protein
VSAPTAIEIGDELRIGDAAFVVTKPAGAEILSRGRRKSEKTFTLRGAVEAMLLTFTIGFGAAQYLAYLFYHQQNRSILAEAVPIDRGEKRPGIDDDAEPAPQLRTAIKG